MTNKNTPEDTLRDGSLKASIWRNEGDKGAYYTTTFARTYEDREGNLKDSHSFSSNDLLRVGELARQAHHRTGELRRAYARAQENGRDADDDRNPDQDRDARTQQDRAPEGRDARRDAFKERRAAASNGHGRQQGQTYAPSM